MKKLPETFRPLLWSLRWPEVDIERDKDDIILNTVNEGTLGQWRWIVQTYGKETIKEVLSRHLITELHPESRHLARVMFDLPPLAHARGSTN